VIVFERRIVFLVDRSAEAAIDPHQQTSWLLSMRHALKAYVLHFKPRTYSSRAAARRWYDYGDVEGAHAAARYPSCPVGDVESMIENALLQIEDGAVSIDRGLIARISEVFISA